MWLGFPLDPRGRNCYDAQTRIRQCAHTLPPTSTGTFGSKCHFPVAHRGGGPQEGESFTQGLQASKGQDCSSNPVVRAHSSSCAPWGPHQALHEPVLKDRDCHRGDLGVPQLSLCLLFPMRLCFGESQRFSLVSPRPSPSPKCRHKPRVSL